MPKCQVLGCSNSDKKKRDPSIKFHTFPANKELRRKWIKFTCRPESAIHKYACICSKHFSEDQRQLSMMNRLLGLPPPPRSRKLAPNAVPNIHHPNEVEGKRQRKSTQRLLVDTEDWNKSSSNLKVPVAKKKRRIKRQQKTVTKIQSVTSPISNKAPVVANNLEEVHRVRPNILRADSRSRNSTTPIQIETDLRNCIPEPPSSLVSEDLSPEPPVIYISEEEDTESPTSTLPKSNLFQPLASIPSKRKSSESLASILTTNDSAEPLSKSASKKLLTPSISKTKSPQVRVSLLPPNKSVKRPSVQSISQPLKQPAQLLFKGDLSSTPLPDSPAVIIQKGPSLFVPAPIIQISSGVFIVDPSFVDSPNDSMSLETAADDSTPSANNIPVTLYDFTTAENLQDWVEISDTVRDVGMSKASFVLQKTQKFQRAVFFTMLNPQPNGAGFAGVSSRSKFNLKDYNHIELHARAQGSVSDYKIVLRHKGLNQEPHPTYEQYFTMPMNEFTTISLPLSNFDPYYRGRKLNSSEAEPLDKSKISSFGFQVYGGVYHPKKQSGISAFEVDWVKAS